MPPELKPVTSSNIESVGHDPEKGELWVKFKTGATHVYSDVDAASHNALVSAESIGRHFHLNIKGQRDSRKHEPEKEG